MEESMKKELDLRFTYHPPHDGQPEVYRDIRGAGRLLASVVVENTPATRERVIAVQKIEEAVMWANAAVARREGADDE